MQRKLRYGRFFALVALIFAVALLVNPALAPAGELEDYQALQKQAIESMQQLKKDMTAGRELKTQYERDMVELDAQLVVLGQQINTAEAAIGTYNALIDEATVAIADATARMNERQAYLESRLRDIYINGDITMLDVFFSAASFNEFIVLYDDVERVMVQDKDVLDDILAARTEIEEEKARIEKLKADQEIILAELSAKNKDLDSLQKQKAKATNELNLSLAQMEANFEAEKAASAEAAKKIAAYYASRAKTAYKGGTFIWPLPPDKNNVTSEYGMRNHPILKKNQMHDGIDIGAPGGTEIYAAGMGTIMYKGWLGGYGNAIMIDHGGDVVTLYGHMSRFNDSFSEGSDVNPYDVIGYVGSTGQSTGNHLHFEVRLNGKSTNPNPYVGR